MKFNNIKNMALTLSALVVLSGCGSDDSDAGTQESAKELESAKAALFFYGADQNDHYALDTETLALTNLNGNTGDEDLENFNLENNESGRLFVWRDDAGDSDEANDEDKVVMFDSTYSFADDGNATYEDFFYLGHYHAEEHDEEGEEEHEDEHEEGHLAAHSNEEFNPANTELNTTVRAAREAGLARLNAYLQKQKTLKENLDSNLSAVSGASDLCNFYSVEEHHEVDGVVHEEMFHFVMDTQGVMYKFEEHDGDIEYLDDYEAVSTIGFCDANKSGISKSPEGILVYLGGDEKKLFLVDSHGDANMHVHTTWNIGEFLGGKVVDTMVGIGDVDAEHAAH
ncbi:MAG: hypothetical protein U9O86_04680 [Campylobacterota bacterium]|nr:hypothetical protein [Campylobacterota bacterium]